MNLYHSHSCLSSDNKSKVTTISNMIIDEARSQAGTWTLAAYNTISDAFPGFSLSDSRFITQRLVEEFINENTESRTRYKIAQLFSLIKNQKLKNFTETMTQFTPEINRFCETLESKKKNEQLVAATLALMKNAFVSPSAGTVTSRVQAFTPPPHFSRSMADQAKLGQPSQKLLQ